MRFKKLTQFLVTTTLVISSSLSAENIITNGSFEEHGPLSQGNWGTFDEIPGWTKDIEAFEIQSGNTAGVNPADGVAKLELDAERNSSINTVIPTETEQPYVLKFQYSPRIEEKGTNTNNVSVWWDGEKINTLSGSKKGWIDQSYIVNASTQNTILKFKAEGKSDSFGGFIDNVEVFDTACFTDNKIQNGSFEEHGSLNNGSWGTFQSISGWNATSGKIEIQEGNSVGVGPAEGLAKAELDSLSNSTMEQVINNLEEGERYQLILQYSPRVVDHSNTNKVRIWWNGKTVSTLNGKKRGWVTKTFTVTASEQNKLKIAAVGKSDSFGGLIDDIQLHKLDCDIENTPPVASDQFVTLEEDNSVEITLDASAANETDELSFSLLTQPANGSLAGDAPNIIYTPNENFFGEDTFTFIANDGKDDSNIATVTIEVNSLNDAPSADSQSLETNEDTDLPISLNGSDVDGDNVTFTIVTSPSNGVITGDVPNFIYTPNPNFNGEDSFTFKTNDGQVDSELATVTVDVKPINDAPVAHSQSLEVNEDASLPILLTGNDGDNNGLIFSLVSPPANGILSGTIPNLVYTPNTNFHGSDSLLFVVNDGTVDSTPAAISITINSVNDLPTVDAGSDQTVIEGTNISLSAVASDSDGQIVSQQWSEAGQVLANTLAFNTNTLSIGVHVLTVSVTDNEGGSATDTAIVTVNAAPNTAPEANSQILNTNEDTAKTIILSGIDDDGDDLTYTITKNPNNGSLTGNAPNLTYTPNANFAGLDAFKFTVNDGNATSTEAIVNITIDNVNDAPIVDAGIDRTFILGRPVTLQAVASDFDGTIESYEWKEDSNVVGSAQGLVLTTLTLGEHIFSVLVTDNEGLTATDNVVVNIVEDTIIPGRLSGKVLDKYGVIIPNAKVTLATGESTVSNSNGNYRINDIIPVDRSTVTAAKNNFLKNSEIINIKSGKETVQVIVLSRPQSITSIDTTTETIVETNGMTVTLPSGEYTNNQGESIEGEITLSASYFPITTEEGINEFPGDTLAEDNQGTIGNLTSFGFIKLELTDNLGNEVLIPQNGQIDLSIPADDSLDKPATIPFWSFDEELGLWVEEGIATYDSVTNTYRTTVFTVNSFNLDKFANVIASLDACIEDSLGNKVAGYLGIESVDKTWRRLFKTGSGELRLEKIIGDIDIDIKAGSDDGRLGEFITNPYYLAPGNNQLDTCIIVDDNNIAESIQVVGSMVDANGSPQSGINISVYGDSSSQYFGSKASVELTKVQTDSNGIFTLDFDNSNNEFDETALEVALFDDKEITIKVVEEDGAKGEKVITLTKGQNNYNLDSILVSPNAAPVANAGLDRTVYLDEIFTFDADKSYDPDDFISTYEWRIGDTILGQGKNFTLHSFAYAGFAVGKHNITLTVTDEFGLKTSDDLFVTVIDRPRHALFADAGLDKTIYLNETIAIETDESLSVGSAIYYKWTEGDTVLHEGNAASGSRLWYEGTELGVHTIKLTVTNTHGLEEVDEVKITVVENEHFLFADAGIDRTYHVGDVIRFVRGGFSRGSNISSVEWKENGVVIDTDAFLDFPSTEVGVYNITLTLKNHHGLESSDEMTITIIPAPPSRVDEDLFLKIRLTYRSSGSAIASIKEIQTTGGVRSYNWTDNGVTISNRSDTTISSNEPGLHTIKLTITDYSDQTISDEIDIFVAEKQKGIHADAEKDKAVYLGDGVDISGYESYSLSSSLSYSWVKDGVELSTQSSWDYIPTELGLHTITLTVTDTDGLVDSDEMTVLVTPRRDNEIYADAGRDKSTYLEVDVSVGSPNESYTLNGNLYYAWSEEGVELSNNPTFNYQSDQEGPHTIKLTVTDSNGLVDTDEMIVNVFGEIDTIKPVITLNGEENITMLQGDIYTELGATAVDDRDGVITTNIITSNALSTTYSLGIHTIVYTVQDQAGNQAEKTRKVNIVPAGTDITPPVITLIGDNPTTIIQGTEYNDQGATVLDNRDGSIGYSFDSNVNTSVTGIYQFVYTATDQANNTSTATRTVRVTDTNGNIDNIKPVITLIGESPIDIIIGSVYLDEGATAVDNIEGDITPKIITDNTVNANVLGTYQITYTVRDNANNEATISRTVNVIDQNEAAPVVVITNLDSQEITTVTEPIDIKGSVSDDNLESWTLSYRETGFVNTTDAVVLAQGTSNVDDQVLAKLDPTLLLNGLYEIILKATDENGLSTIEFSRVLIDGDLKVGNFSISFEDLSIPTAGIPLTVTRTYDTRQRNKKLDFGQGWSLGFENIRIQEGRTPGFGWDVVTYPSGPQGLIPNHCIETNNDNIVSVSLADGEVKKFQAKTSPECNQVTPIFEVNMVFEAIGDDNGAKLEALNNSSGRLIDGSIFIIGEGVIDPSLYKLTTKEGREIIIDQSEGVREIYEPELGNRVTITHDGITHSEGASVTFVRDAEDRITQIVSPDGETLSYSYDGNGDLTAFTNRAVETTTFAYLSNPNLPHYLEDIIDPRGIRVARNEYDEDGRLTAHIDADGNRIEYTRDIQGRTETVKDRNGNSTTYVYNDRGDVVAQTNGEGETTTYTYDRFGNELSKTDALGNTQSQTIDNIGNVLSETDALGNTSTSTYGVFNQFNTQTDALGRTVISNTYANYEVLDVPILPGPLERITDALGNRILLGYTSAGVNSITDVLGNVTQTEYNSSGFITASIDALGVRTDYTVDEMGNRLTETTTRTNAAGATDTLTTTHVYDAKDNLIQTTDALGNVTRMEYNSINKMSADIDANGNRTEYEYDSRGNQSKITYPDGSTATLTYDAENNKLSETDRLGRTTTYMYDKVNRLIETILPDVTAGDLTDNPRTKTEYDDAGRVSAAIDANGNRTSYGYDAAGRRTNVTDALGNVSTYAYDAVGNQTSFTDANNNTMSYEYDVLDRRTKTTYADGTNKSVGYDALGRKVSETDQAGVTTNYAYDALGRLIKVTDVQANETSYAYDEQGNKISQTDAEGRITQWAYDKLGRIISRTLPLGQVESMTYDAVGNVITKTDFNGQTATMVYDVNNRLITSTYADGQIDGMVYDVVGNRTQATITDTSGTRTYTYSYDSQNRLVSETQADATVLEYQYDNQSNRTQLKSSKGTDVKNVGYDFDILNRLSTVTDTTGITSYAYDAVGNRSTINHANGNIDSYVYDSLNRLNILTHKNSADVVLSSFTYTLDATGKRTKIIEQSGRTTEYTYDNLNRLDTETITDVTNGNYSASYTYDKVGNRTYEIKDGVQSQYTIDDNDRLSQQGGTTYSYDNNGSTLSETLDGNSKTYIYNAKNQLIQTNKAGADTSYQYNADGIREAQTTGIETTQYIVDTNRAYAQVIKESVNNSTTVEYTYGDDLLSQTRNGQSNIYHYDGLGSTRALSDVTGAITDSYDYEAFGETLNVTGTTINSYLYVGEQFDQGLGQYYLRARYYDQGVGRFTQQDTWMGNNSDPITLHKYLYGNADPVNHTDPTGNFSLGSFGAAINTIGTLANIASTTYNVFQFATGEQEFSAKNVGLTIILSHASGKVAKSLLRKLFPCNSFEQGTLIRTPDGMISIEKIKIGDLVYSFNEETNATELKEVTHLISNEGFYDLVSIDTGDGDLINATFEHPFYIDEKWVNAEDITKNNSLFGSDGSIDISKISKIRKKLPVYNFTVKNNHTYFVGRAGVLVHNAKKCRIKLTEQTIPANSFEDARNKALRLLGRIDEKTRKKLSPCNIQNSVANGMVTGFETIVDGVWKQFRVDYDPKKGLHINVKVGKGQGMSVNHAIKFPGPEKMLKKLARCYN